MAMLTDKAIGLSALLLAGVSLTALAPAAEAARILFAAATDASGAPVSARDLPPGQTIVTTGGTVQLMLDNGALVSFVGPSRFSVRPDGGIAMSAGAMTLAMPGTSSPVTVTLPGGAQAVVSGSGGATFNFDGRNVSGMSLGSSVAMTADGTTRTFGPAQAYQTVGGAAPTLVFATPAQNVPAAGGGSAPPGDRNPIVQLPPDGMTPAAVASTLAGYQPPLFAPPYLQALADFAAGTTPGGGTDPGTDPGGTDPGGTDPGGSTTPPPANSGAGTLGTAAKVRTSVRATTGRERTGIPTSRTVTAAGGLDSVAYNGNAPSTRGTAGNADVYANGTVAIGRWTDGTTEGGGSPFLGSTLNANQGIAYALTLKAGTLPVAGTATYDLSAATKPVLADGSVAPGMMTASKLGVTFGSRASVGLDATIVMPEAGGNVTYTLASVGGAADPSRGGGFLSGDGSFSVYVAAAAIAAGGGAVCAGAAPCAGSASGALAGNGFDGAALTYQINNKLTGAAAYHLGAGSGLSTTVGSGTASGSSAGSGLANGYNTVLYRGTGAANSLQGIQSNAGRYYTQFSAGDGSLSIVNTVLSETAGGVITERRIEAGRETIISEAAAGPGWMIGRWNGGTVVSETYGNGIFGPNQGVHTVAMSVAGGVLPEGTATYALKAATRPTFADGRATTSASFAADLAISFGPSLKYGFSGRIDVTDAAGAQTYAFSTLGGTADPRVPTSALGNAFLASGSLDATGTGSACPTGSVNCRLSYQLLSGGEAASLVGLTYQLSSAQSSPATEAPAITGAGLFGQTGLMPRADAAGTDYAGQTLIYAGSNVGADYRAGYIQRVTDAGVINRFNQPIAGGEAVWRGSNTALESGKAMSGTDFVAWTRWGGGTSEGTFYGPAAMAQARTTDQGFSMATGTPATALPTAGTAQYELAGATKPTLSDGSVAAGTFAGTLGVDFASKKAGVDFGVGVGGHTYALKTAGGSADPSNGGLALQNGGAFFGAVSVPVGGPVCTGSTCQGTVDGQLYGAGGKLAGVAYLIQGTTTGIDPKGISGVAVFKAK